MEADGGKTPLARGGSTVSAGSETWVLAGKNMPRSEIVFFSQIIIIFIVVVASVINLSLGNQSTEMWLIMLSTSVGAILPNPSMKRIQSASVVSNNKERAQQKEP
jgi:hypothetical protein